VFVRLPYDNFTKRGIVRYGIAGPPRCPVWCRLVTVPTDPFTTFTSPTGPLLSEWAKCQLGNTQDGRTVLPIANLMADSESGSPVSYSRFLVTICLSGLVSEIFACCSQTDGRTTRTITIGNLRIVAGQLKIIDAESSFLECGYIFNQVVGLV